jgi:hypothetical protein
MEIDLDTFLTALYCTVDDAYQAGFARFKTVRPGHQPELSDSEVVTLALLFQWQFPGGERPFLAYAVDHWRAYFPRLLSQSAFNRRVRDLAIVLSQLGPQVARRIGTALLDADYEVVDGLPIPLMRRCRGDQHRLFADDAGLGRGGSDGDWYYGVKLVSAVSPAGIITGFVVSPASTEERWSVDALLRWRDDPTAPAPTAPDLATVLGAAHRAHGQRQGPTGPIRGRFSAGQTLRGCYLADEGERGRAWQAHWAEDYGASLVTRSALTAELTPPEKRAFTKHFRSVRQVIETVHHTLIRVFGITFPRARTPWGLFARIAAKIAAHDLSVCLNALYHRPTFAPYNPFLLSNAGNLAR